MTLFGEYGLRFQNVGTIHEAVRQKKISYGIVILSLPISARMNGTGCRNETVDAACHGPARVATNGASLFKGKGVCSWLYYAA